ncbi:ferredoxin--NADP reductase [uncultured Roseovarius sp.]|uniref:ferredoxin--NADP reductase n=1 Tax=uncultured Roseovarius sp. TaxID=293344 RepID=UPI002634D211|nr:ferredoxin--NADP reductase [uncultured Roseovarius sp.]
MSNDQSVATGPAHYRLTVKAIREETSDAKSFVLVPERGEAPLFRYTPGQFLSFRIPFQGRNITRSYSLSSAPGADPDMRICVKRVKDGRGSNWFNDHLSAGARIEATVPSGRFVLRDRDAPLLLIAGGSGITPCISLLKKALLETGRQVRLIYANRDASSIIYHNELELLQKKFSGRLDCVHRLDDRDGFLTQEDVISLARGWHDADTYICGPAPLMDMAENTLTDALGDRAYIMTERFVSPDDDVAKTPDATQDTGPQEAPINDFRLTLDGVDHMVPYKAGQTLLQAALDAGIDAPVSCTEGHCGTCMSALKSGKVQMATTKALSKRNLERGYVLACQSRPCATETLWLDFDL